MHFIQVVVLYTQEAEADGSQWIWSQLSLQREFQDSHCPGKTLSQKTNKQKEKEKKKKKHFTFQWISVENSFALNIEWECHWFSSPLSLDWSFNELNWHSTTPQNYASIACLDIGEGILKVLEQTAEGATEPAQRDLSAKGFWEVAFELSLKGWKRKGFLRWAYENQVTLLGEPVWQVWTQKHLQTM